MINSKQTVSGGTGLTVPPLFYPIRTVQDQLLTVDAGPIGEVIRKYSPVGKLPAISLIGVQALAEERFLVEVDAEAVVEVEH